MTSFKSTLMKLRASDSTLKLAAPRARPRGELLLTGQTITLQFGPSVVVPLPGALPLFATGLGAMGLLGWRRKRKAQAVA